MIPSDATLTRKKNVAKCLGSLKSLEPVTSHLTFNSEIKRRETHRQGFKGGNKAKCLEVIFEFMKSWPVELRVCVKVYIDVEVL